MDSIVDFSIHYKIPISYVELIKNVYELDSDFVHILNSKYQQQVLSDTVTWF
jgi:hypothetical protein